MMMDGKTRYGDDIQKLAQVMAEPESTDTLPSGQRRTLDLLDAYVDHIRDTVKLARPMKIAIDCGNGVGGAVAARLFRALGCEVDELSRSEERRVGKECVSTCRSRWAPVH